VNKFLMVLVCLTLLSCATQFKEAHTYPDGRKGAFGYRIETVAGMSPFTNYAAFTGNKETTDEQAIAYTKMAALIHCTEQGRLLMIDSQIRNVRDKVKITRQRAYETGDQGQTSVRRPENYKAYMVLFGCSDQNSKTKIQEKKEIVEDFCKIQDSHQGKYCSSKSVYKQ